MNRSDTGFPSDAGLPDNKRSSDILSEDTMELLFKQTVPRRPAPADFKAEVFAAVEEKWQDEVRRRSDRRRIFAMAAAVLLVAGLSALVWVSGLKGPADTSLTATSAVVEAWFTEAEPPFPVGASLAAGSEVRTTATERAALRTARGMSLRLGPSTHLRLVDGETVELLSGVVYADSGGDERGRELIEIRTTLGNTTDIGTQFEVHLADDTLRVRVREGKVRLDRDGVGHEASAGTQLTVDPSGTVALDPLPENGDWSWAVQTAPAFELEGHTLAEVLRWVARETGWTVLYEDEALAEEAETVKTHGSVDGLSPDQVPELVIPTAGLAFNLEGNRLHILRQTGP